MPDRDDAVNVLYVNSTPELGGANIQLIEILKNLDLMRFRPVIVNPPQEVFRTADFDQFGRPVYTMRLGVIKRSGNPLAIVRFLFETAVAVPRLIRLIKKERIAIVHANTATVISGALAARISRVPLIWHIHEVFSPAPVRILMCRLILSLADRVAVISNAVRDQFPPPARSRIEVVYDGIDVDKLRPVKEAEKDIIRRQLGIDAQGPLIGMVGRFVPWKGQATFIRACAKIKEDFPEARFILAGQTFDELTGYTDDLERLVCELNLGDRLRFEFWCDDSAKLMSALDVFVHASERPEPFGLVVIEAMAMEKPVVATVGGVREIVSSDVGITVPAKDPSAISSAVIRLLENKVRAKEMGKKGRARVEKMFSSDLTVKRLTDVYEELLR